MRIKRPSPAMVVAVAALVLAAGGFAIAAIPTADGTIHGCYEKDGGALRIVKGAGGCKAGERSLSWNRGVARVTVRRAKMAIHRTCMPFGPSQYTCSGKATRTVPCKAGERATGGGYSTNSAENSVQASKPFPEAGKPTGWTIAASAFKVSSTPTATNSIVPIYAVCAN